jgi:hypothetical protein
MSVERRYQVITGRARLLGAAVILGVVVAASAVGSAALAENEAESSRNFFRVELTGLQEDPQALSTTGEGQVRVFVNERTQEITYRLSYESLEGSVLQAHIHVGNRSQSGGISVFLCTNLGNGPAGTPACPAPSGVVTGTLSAASVIGPAAQGITAGQFDELVAAMQAGTTYANVHSSLYPGGEIRGQLDHRH